MVLPELATVTLVGITYFLEGVAVGLCSSFLRGLPPDPYDWAMEALLRLSPPWGIASESATARGPVDGGLAVWLLRWVS
jgi:hypothetical protein